MRGVVHPAESYRILCDFNLVDAARILDKPPIRRERHIQELSEQNSVDTIVTNQDDCVRRMSRENITQQAGGSSCNVLKGLAVRETSSLRIPEPRREQIRIHGSRLLVRQPLPLAVVEISQFGKAC